MMHKTVLAVVAAVALVATTVTAGAYEGNWFYDNNDGGSEVLMLGDNSDDTFRVLRGTDRYCGRPGASYARVRNVLANNDGEQIVWWVADECTDGYVRVCVENWYSERACSTYWDGGWN